MLQGANWPWRPRLGNNYNLNSYDSRTRAWADGVRAKKPHHNVARRSPLIFSIFLHQLFCTRLPSISETTSHKTHFAGDQWSPRLAKQNLELPEFSFFSFAFVNSVPSSALFKEADLILATKIVPAGPVRGILQGGHQVFSTILMYTEKRGRGTILVAIESKWIRGPRQVVAIIAFSRMRFFNHDQGFLLFSLPAAHAYDVDQV